MAMIKRTTIYLDEKTHEAAKALAKHEGRSLSNYLTCLVWDAKKRLGSTFKIEKKKEV